MTATNPRLTQWPRLKFDFKSGTGFSGLGGAAQIYNGRRKIIIATNLQGEATWNGRTERLLKRFDARTGKPLGSPIVLETGAVDLEFSPDGRQLAVGEHGFALVLNAQTLKTERRLNVVDTLPSGAVAAPVCVAWSADSATLAASTMQVLKL